MKKTILLLSFLLLFVIAPSFSSNTQETDVSEDLLESASTLKNVITTLMNQETDRPLSLSDAKESLMAGIYDLDQQSETESVSRATTTLFVTGIKSDYYLTPSEIPYSIPYSYLRGSDGAYFSGTINYYYMRYGYIGPLPSVFYYQVFYEGNLDFQFYVY